MHWWWGLGALQEDGGTLPRVLPSASAAQLPICVSLLSPDFSEPPPTHLPAPLDNLSHLSSNVTTEGLVQTSRASEPASQGSLQRVQTGPSRDAMPPLH